ncbi:MAG: hypothetical protein J6037_02745, partial [Bacteroidales bacterium]|nr:hypothetical protein [Bacteroidales bacterium]
WQKTASGQHAIGRAQALVMPTKAVTPTLGDFYLRGWINNADVENNSIAFSSGKVNSYTFSSDSYLYLYSNSTSKAYVPASSVDSGTSAECFKVDSWDKSTCPKLKVPAGTYEINISYNSAGSITLSYTSK